MEACELSTIKDIMETIMQMGGRDANMFDKRTSIYLKIIANMHKALDKWSMVGIRIIHNTK
jgi:hypothetical protein